MNTSKYKGIPKYQSPAFIADRSAYAALGEDAYNAMRREREDYYRDLLRQVREERAKKAL